MKDLADKVGTSQQQIDRLEKGKRRLTVEWMMRLGKALQCDVSELLPQSARPAHTMKAKVIGTITSGNEVKWFNHPSEHYTIIFSRPAVTSYSRGGVFALKMSEAHPAFSQYSELVFSELYQEESLPDGKMVLCTSSEENGGEKVYELLDTPLPQAGYTPHAILIKSIRDE